MCPKFFLHLHIWVLIHDFTAWGLHRWPHKKAETVQYVRDATCSFIQIFNPFYDVFRCILALKKQEQKFWKKTFGVPIIVNLENGIKFCIFKKITPGSSALYFEKKNESQLRAKWASEPNFPKLSQNWAKWAKLPDGLWKSFILAQKCSSYWLKVIHIGSPKLFIMALKLFLLAQWFFILAQ